MTMIDNSPGKVNPVSPLRELAHAIVAQHRQHQERLTPPRVAVALILSEAGLDAMTAVSLSRSIDAIYQRGIGELPALRPITNRCRKFSPEVLHDIAVNPDARD